MTERIGFDVTSALTQGGGIGRYTRELINALVVADPDRHYRLFSARPPAKPPVPNALPAGSNVSYCPTSLDEQWLYRLWYRLRLPLPVQHFTGRLDLFHSPDFVLPPTAEGIPTILTVHDLSFIHYPEAFPPALVRYLNRAVPWSITRATHVLADSVSTERDLIEIWGVPADRITVLYCGVDRRFQPVSDPAASTAVRQRYGLGDLPYVLSVGTLQPRKNYGMLIRAFRRVADRLPHNLVIAGGKGWLYEQLTEEVERQGLAGRVLFTGFVDDADLPVLYSAASLFMFPSLYEGFGLPLLEAMACGAPVISSNASSLPEVAAADPPAALLLSPHDEDAWGEAILQLLTDDLGRRSLIEAGFAQARHFDWAESAARLADLYDRLLN